ARPPASGKRPAKLADRLRAAGPGTERDPRQAPGRDRRPRGAQGRPPAADPKKRRSRDRTPAPEAGAAGRERRWGRKRQEPDAQAAAQAPHDEWHGQTDEWQGHAPHAQGAPADWQEADEQWRGQAEDWRTTGGQAVPDWQQTSAEWASQDEQWQETPAEWQDAAAGWQDAAEWQDGPDGGGRQDAAPDEPARKRPRGKGRERAGRRRGPAGRTDAERPARGPDGPVRDPSGAQRPKNAGLAARMGSLPPRVFYGAAGALAVIFLVGALAVVVVGGGDDGGPDGRQAPQSMGRSPAVSGPAPASYSSSPSTEAYRGIAQRSADRAPLTVGEAFPESANKITVQDAGTRRLTLKVKSLDTDCSLAVWGTSMGGQLREHGCTQAARTLYADDDGEYALSVTVFNLNTASDADRFVDEIGQGRGGGFVRPLPAASPLDRFGRGFGMARGLAMGHYAVVAWAQRLDGKGDETDETLLSLLIEGGKAPGPLGRAARAS
ncbi:hypothetical protein, partial [Actinomadura miaoliensis]|uniref:hypothetical protein n=1 Tax=Actinomadura miaoliensis TaxID=430685 RepID=UPI0031EC500A